MKIVISAGGRFHAIKLAQQLTHHKSLLRLFSFSCTSSDTQLLGKSQVTVIKMCQILDYIFLKLRLSRLINASIFNNIKDNLFDYFVNKQIKKLPNFDLFIGWAHYSLNTIQTARKKGAIVIIESGSSHILEQQRLLEEEYKKWGINFTPIHPNVVAKMTQEYELADYIMTLSSASKQSFITHGIPEHKMLQAPCGIDVEYFLPTEFALRGFSKGERLGATNLLRPAVPSGTSLEAFPLGQYSKNKMFRVIFVGIINIRKGIPYLLEAWNSLNLPEESTELVLVGSMQKDVAQLLPKLQLKKNVVFYGPTNRETLKKLYYQSSVFVLPSVEDGFGMVMGEAMASGLPVICTTNTGAPDVIENGIHGFLIPPQNSFAIAEKIAWCYEHEAESIAMGQAGRKRIGDFTWNAYGTKVFEIYEKILGLGRAREGTACDEAHCSINHSKAFPLGEPPKIKR